MSSKKKRLGIISTRVEVMVQVEVREFLSNRHPRINPTMSHTATALPTIEFIRLRLYSNAVNQQVQGT